MGTPLRIIESPKGGAWDALQPGDMWRDPGQDAHGREAWMILLPSAAPDGKYNQGLNLWCTVTQDEGKLWTVTGTPPNITVKPSINVVGDWHGWITNGEMSPA